MNTKAKRIWVTSFCCLLALIFAGLQSNGQREARLDCLAEITIPEYPPLARQARRTGLVKVQLSLGRYGRVEEVKVNGSEELLNEAVQKSLSSARFKPDCNGRRLELEFVFELENDSHRNYDPGRVIFRSPASFVIRSSFFPMSG